MKSHRFFTGSAPSRSVDLIHVIDCDAEPFIPMMGTSVESHQKGGKLIWDATKVVLHQEPEQRIGQSLKGTELMKRLVGRLVLNANVLDDLLTHPELIPESWIGTLVFFPGTVYRDFTGDLVRCLYFIGGRWDQYENSLGYDFDRWCAVAILKSTASWL